VVHSVTPGMAQLGGVWLPLTHLLLVPFVANDFLWQTGLAGGVVSGGFFIVAGVYLYKLIWQLTKSVAASWVGLAIFSLNPNLLYLQSTAMTEIPLIALFLLSIYYFVKFLHNDRDLLSLVLAALFCFAATITRYDGWFLAIIEAGLIIARFGWVGIQKRSWAFWPKMEGLLLLYSTLAFFGIALWLVWNTLILGDSFYFTNSDFSAKTQQESWEARGELPAYKDLPLSLFYYAVTTLENSGLALTLLGLIGVIFFLFDAKIKARWLILILTLTPFIFNVLTLYLGQSVIFIPSLTPDSFEWSLFNVRYGTMMIPSVALFTAYLLYRFQPWILKTAIIFLTAAQSALFVTGQASAISLDDGVKGLSASRPSDAENWLKENYDGGLVLMDDFARTVSVIRTGIPMQNTIYLGNKPYWEESLTTPEKHARWIVIQENDAVWNALYEPIDKQQHLYKYFEKAYTSPTILIFKRNQVQ
jgi:hypothetical protein